MPLKQLSKKAQPPPDLEPEYELPPAPKEELLESGEKKVKNASSAALVAGLVIVIVILLLALLAIALS
ncbi:hypothetical protein ACFL04_02905 [Patescibacteria group bacterium]